MCSLSQLGNISLRVSVVEHPFDLATLGLSTPVNLEDEAER